MKELILTRWRWSILPCEASEPDPDQSRLINLYHMCGFTPSHNFELCIGPKIVLGSVLSVYYREINPNHWCVLFNGEIGSSTILSSMFYSSEFLTDFNQIKIIMKLSFYLKRASQYFLPIQRLLRFAAKHYENMTLKITLKSPTSLKNLWKV